MDLLFIAILWDQSKFWGMLFQIFMALLAIKKTRNDFLILNLSIDLKKSMFAKAIYLDKPFFRRLVFIKDI